VAKRMWLPQQEVYKSTARVPPMEKNGNEKKEHIILSRIFGKTYKKLRRGSSISLPVAAAQLFFLSKHPGTGRRRKRRMGMIQKNNILEEENMPLTMSYILNNVVADELSPRLCFYILKNSEGRLHSVCAGGCSADERRADYRKKKGSSTDSLNGGSGKKFRKIFVRI